MSKQIQKTAEASNGEALVPFQVKARPDVRERIVAVAKKTGLSQNDIASMALGAGLDRVIKKLSEIQHSETTEANA